MAKDLGDVIGTAVGRVAREAAQSVAANAGKRRKGPLSGKNPLSSNKGQLSGAKGVAAGAGLAAAVPLAVKGAKLVKRGFAGGSNPVEKAGDKLGGGVKDAVGKKVDEAGGAAGMAKEAGKGLLPGGGGGGGGEAGGQPGVGKGRRMPVQQSVDVPVPVSTAYNQWTQFEEWPNFMHRLERVTQEDETHVSFKAKIWGVSKEFNAEIVEQRPEERMEWRVTEGLNPAGVVPFHELADRLTRIEVNLDVQPGSLIEKAARGMRHVKRAVRADLSRFKAYTVMNEEEDGAWRGTIDDGEVTSSESDADSGSESSGSRGSNGSGSQSERRRATASSRSGSRRSSGGQSRSSGGQSRGSSKSSGRSRSKSSGSRSSKSSSSSKRASG